MQSNGPLHQIIPQISSDQSSYTTHPFYSNLSTIWVAFVTKGDLYMPYKAMASFHWVPVQNWYPCGNTYLFIWLHKNQWNLRGLIHAMAHSTKYASQLAAIQKNSHAFLWKPMYQVCMDNIEALVCKLPMLHPIDRSNEEKIWVICDPSPSGICSVYRQGPDLQSLRPAGFMSKNLQQLNITTMYSRWRLFPFSKPTFWVGGQAYQQVHSCGHQSWGSWRIQDPKAIIQLPDVVDGKPKSFWLWYSVHEG